MKRSDCSATQKDQQTKNYIVFIIFISFSHLRWCDGRREIGSGCCVCFCCISIKRPGGAGVQRTLSCRTQNWICPLAGALRGPHQTASEKLERCAQAFYLVHHVVLVGALQKSCCCWGWGRECCVRTWNRNRSTGGKNGLQLGWRSSVLLQGQMEQATYRFFT